MTPNTPTAHNYSGLGAAVATAAIAFGVGYFAVASAAAVAEAASSKEEDALDTTTRLLSGGNRARTLRSLAAFERGQFTARELLER